MIGTTHYFLYDGHGSTRLLINAAQPILQVIEPYDYDAYGNLLNHPPAAGLLTTLLYSGERTDAATGMQCLRARYYDRAIGRFNQLDPYAGVPMDPQSLYKSLYTHGNPVKGIDPSGLIEFSYSGLLLATTLSVYLDAVLLPNVSPQLKVNASDLSLVLQ